MVRAVLWTDARRRLLQGGRIDRLTSTGGALMILHSLAGLPAFALYFIVSVALCVAFLIAYIRLAPHEEFELIAHHANASASVALGMSLIGFALPLASAIYHSSDIIDCVVWGIVALFVQVAAFYLARIGQPNLSKRIANDEMAGALWLGFVSLAAGILSASCMST
jgi:putative membrane protein